MSLELRKSPSPIFVTSIGPEKFPPFAQSLALSLAFSLLLWGWTQSEQSSETLELQRLSMEVEIKAEFNKSGFTFDDEHAVLSKCNYVLLISLILHLFSSSFPWKGIPLTSFRNLLFFIFRSDFLHKLQAYAVGSGLKLGSILSQQVRDFGFLVFITYGAWNWIFHWFRSKIIQLLAHLWGDCWNLGLLILWVE